MRSAKERESDLKGGSSANRFILSVVNIAVAVECAKRLVFLVALTNAYQHEFDCRAQHKGRMRVPAARRQNRPDLLAIYFRLHNGDRIQRKPEHCRSYYQICFRFHLGGVLVLAHVSI